MAPATRVPISSLPGLPFLIRLTAVLAMLRTLSVDMRVTGTFTPWLASSRLTMERNSMESNLLVRSTLSPEAIGPTWPLSMASLSEVILYFCAAWALLPTASRPSIRSAI